MSTIEYSGAPDPKWVVVDEYLSSRLGGPKGQPEIVQALENAISHSSSSGLPDIAVSAAQGRWLMVQARLLGVKHVLEVGTLGGYSAIWLAAASPDIRITTVELEPEHARIARENLDAAGKAISERVEIIVGSGVDVLPRLAGEVRDGKRPRFGLAFIDADKENNWFYFDSMVGMAEPGACIVVDNVVRYGKLGDDELAKQDPRIAGSRRVIEEAAKDPRVSDGAVLQTVGDKGLDGFFIAMVAH